MNLKQIKLFLSAAVLATFFMSCDKDDNNPDTPYKDVFGEWTWIETQLGLTNEKVYADSVDYNQTLKITNDEVYQWRKDDNLLIDTKFEIKEDTAKLYENADYYFDFTTDSLAIQSFYTKNKDTLYLSDECTDCDKYTFIRKK